MSDWREGFYEAIKEYCGLSDDSIITEIEDETFSSGFCDTCYSESTYIVVRYLEQGLHKTHNTYMNMGELMRSL